MKLIIFVIMLLIPLCAMADPHAAHQYINEAGVTTAISPTNKTVVAAGVDKYSEPFNVQYSEHQSFGIKVTAGAATSFSVSVQAYAVDSDGTIYYEDINPAQSFPFTGDTEERYPLSLPVGIAFRFKFVSDALAAYEVERLTVYRK